MGVLCATYCSSYAKCSYESIEVTLVIHGGEKSALPGVPLSTNIRLSSLSIKNDLTNLRFISYTFIDFKKLQYKNFFKFLLKLINDY